MIYSEKRPRIYLLPKTSKGFYSLKKNVFFEKMHVFFSLFFSENHVKMYEKRRKKKKKEEKRRKKTKTEKNSEFLLKISSKKRSSKKGLGRFWE